MSGGQVITFKLAQWLLKYRSAHVQHIQKVLHQTNIQVDLTQVDGLSAVTAQMILTETGVDLYKEQTINRLKQPEALNCSTQCVHLIISFHSEFGFQLVPSNTLITATP
jgi:hypothetical protein